MSQPDQQLELNKIYNMDCLVGMKQVPDGSIDMILCDLPYGVTQNKWDVKIPLDELWAQYKRIIKPDGAIVLFSQHKFMGELIMSNPKWFRYEWIWRKNCPVGFLNANRTPLRVHENILVFYKKLPTYNPQMKTGYKPYIREKKNHVGGNYRHANEYTTRNNGTRYPVDVLKFDSVNTSSAEHKHPTQKPVALCEYLVRTYTNEGETVLDNCMGSGTTAIAALNTGRNFIGFELDKSYHKIATDRISTHVAPTLQEV